MVSIIKDITLDSKILLYFTQPDGLLETIYKVGVRLATPCFSKSHMWTILGMLLFLCGEEK